MKILIFLILALAAIVRLSTLSKLMVFNPDEEYLLYLAQTLVKDFHLIWIGVSALGFDVYMGPLWIYIIYPFVGLTRGDPLVLGVLTSLLGLVTTFLIFILGKKMFSEKAGLIASSLYAFSALIIYYDQQPYPPGVPFLSTFIVLSLYMTKFSNKWWFVFAIGYGLVFHIHLSLLLLIFIAIYWAFLQRKTLTKKIILLSSIIFLITISPLIIFDYFHKASNITTPLRIIQSGSRSTNSIGVDARLNSFFQSLGRLAYLDSFKNSADEILNPCFKSPVSTTTKAPWFISLTVLLFLIYFVVKKNIWKDETKRLLLLTSLSFLIPFTVLPIIRPIEYYLLGMFPIIFLMIAYVIESLSKKAKLLCYISLVIFAAYGSFTVLNANGDFGLSAKKELVLIVAEKIGNEPYDLDDAGDCQRYGGWRYLFSTYARKPERSSEDKIFSWLYPSEVTTRQVKFSIVIKETRASLPEITGYKKALSNGGFTAYIFEK